MVALSCRGLQKKIADYLFERAPKHASAVIRKIHDSCRLLLGFPEIGRLGNLEGTREFVVSPYIIVYQVRNEIVYVVRILHGAQDWLR